MGLKPTKLPWYVLAVGLSGSLFMLWFEVYSMSELYPFIVGGKPLFSLPAFVPVWYEITVLSSCLTAFFRELDPERAASPHHPAFQSKAFERVTDDKFFIMVEATDAKFDRDRTKALLHATGASLIEELED